LSDDRKTFARVACARSFNACIQGEQIGLESDLVRPESVWVL